MTMYLPTLHHSYTVSLSFLHCIADLIVYTFLLFLFLTTLYVRWPSFLLAITLPTLTLTSFSLPVSSPNQVVQAFGDEKLALVSLLLAHGELYIADRVLLSDRAGELMAFHSPLAGAPPLPHPIYMNHHTT